MKSLRRRLLVSLWCAVSIVGAVSAAISYRQVNHEAKELLDNQLEQIARIVAAQGRDPPHPAKTDDIEVAVWDADGTLRYASSPRMSIPFPAAQGFTEMILSGQPYRLYATVIGGRHIKIAQPVDTREDQAEAAALSAFLPLLLLFPVLAAVIALVIRSLLQPVRSIAAAVAHRDPFDGKSLPTQSLPTEVAPLVEEINRLLERQSAAVLREREFIADAAHALRTPLAALQLQADVLDGSSDPAERAARLLELRAGIARSARLSSQLLSLARIELIESSSTIAVDLDATLHEIQALYRPTAAARGITLCLDAQSAAEVHGDQGSLMLICGNLLDNALRHSPLGGRVELLSDTESDVACIEVRDEGRGLDPKQLERVFARFYCAPGEANTGSGLGLACVKSLVTQLGGRVSLHNRLDRTGLIARVILPLAMRPHHELAVTMK